MNLSDLTDLLLTAVTSYGPLALALVFLAAAVGLPLPSTLFVVAGGAFVQQGLLPPAATIAVGMAGVVLGDMLSYGAGRLLHGRLRRRYGSAPAWRRAEAAFARRAPLAIVLTRCVLTPIAVPVNLIAGGSAYPPGRFALFAAAGELAWLLSYGALGYLFAGQWERVAAALSGAAAPLAGLAVAGAGLYALLHRQAEQPRPQVAGRAA